MSGPTSKAGAIPALSAALILVALFAALWTFSPRHPPPKELRVLALSPSGGLLAAGTSSGAIQVWNLETRALHHAFQDPTGNLNDLQFSPDEAYLAVANRNLTLHSIANLRDNRALRDDQANYGSVRFHPTASTLLTINGKGEVMTLDIPTKQRKFSFCCTSIWGDVDFDSQGIRVLWAGHWPGIFDLSANQLLARFTKTYQEMTFGPILIDSLCSLVFMGSQDGRVYAWDLETRQLIARSPALQGYVRTIAVLSDGWLAMAATGGPVHLWHPAASKFEQLQAARPTSNLVYDPTRHQTLFGNASGKVEVWDLLNRQQEVF